MKKIFLVTAFVVFGFGVAQAQDGFKVGAVAALPVGDASDLTTFGLGLEAAYLFEIYPGFLLGATAGYHYFLGETEPYLEDDIQYLPVAASARYNFSEKFFAGADLGYAFGIYEENESGFYYRPKVGYNLGFINVQASFGGVIFDSENGDTFNFHFIGLGVEFGF